MHRASPKNQENGGSSSSVRKLVRGKCVGGYAKVRKGLRTVAAWK